MLFSSVLKVRLGDGSYGCTKVGFSLALRELGFSSPLDPPIQESWHTPFSLSGVLFPYMTWKLLPSQPSAVGL